MNQMQGVGTNHSNLSQSAPATTGGAVWAGGHTPVVNQHDGMHHHHHHHHSHAQQMTGMMGATILDEVEVEGWD